MYDEVENGTLEEQPEEINESEELESNGETQDEQLENDSQEQLSEWQRDARYKTHWKESPDELYRSYKDLEKKYTPLSGQVSQYERQLNEYRQKEESIGKHQQILDFINHVGSHPRLSRSLEDFVQNTLGELKRDKYGDLPDEYIDRLSSTERKNLELEERFREIEQEKHMVEEKGRINETLQDIDKFSAQYGIQFDIDQKIAFLSYCQKNKIPTQYMADRFYKLAIPEIAKTISSRSKTNALSTVQKNSRSGIIPSQNKSIQNSSSTKNGMSAEDREILAAWHR